MLLYRNPNGYLRMTSNERHSQCTRRDHGQRDHDFHESEAYRIVLTHREPEKISNQECDPTIIAAQAKLVFFQQTQKSFWFLIIGSVTNKFWEGYFVAIKAIT